MMASSVTAPSAVATAKRESLILNKKTDSQESVFLLGFCIVRAKHSLINARPKLENELWEARDRLLPKLMSGELVVGE